MSNPMATPYIQSFLLSMFPKMNVVNEIFISSQKNEKKNEKWKNSKKNRFIFF